MSARGRCWRASREGDANFVPANPSLESLRIEIRAGSLEVPGDINNKDRREMESIMKQQTVLDASQYPTIIYEGAGNSASH